MAYSCMQGFCALKVLIESVKVVIEHLANMIFVSILAHEEVPVSGSNSGFGLDTWLVIYEQFGRAHFSYDSSARVSVDVS